MKGDLVMSKREFGLMDLYLTSNNYLDAEQVDERHYLIHLSNGKEIEVENRPVYDGKPWAWRVGTQIFDNEAYAVGYLKQLIAEKLTGKRIILHSKQDIPEICGVDGAACRCHGRCNSMLCTACPVAEKFFADRDGVELVYAI